LIEAASKQQHGTMVVISTDAEDEATRLANQSTPIESIPLNASLVNAVSGNAVSHFDQ
jgi:hypothetical protein